MAIIRIKRGNKANLPSNVNAGEPVLAIDTGELFYGNSSGTTVPVKLDRNNLLNMGTDTFYPAADKSKLAGIANGATNVGTSATNGNIVINGVEKTVYTHPSTHPASMITGSVSGISGSTVDTILSNLKLYTDSVKQALDIKDSVKAATTANITLSGTQTIDGVALNVGDRVLVKDQTITSENGIYVVQSGAWTRASDADGTNNNVTPGMFTFVEEGNINGLSGWVLTYASSITVGITTLNFAQFSGAGQIIAGTGLSKSGNQISIANVGTPGTYTKVTTNAQGQVTSGTSLSASDIPSLDTSKLTSGTLPTSRGGTGTTGFAASKVVVSDASGNLTVGSIASTDVASAATLSSHIGSGGSSHALAVNGGAAGFMSGTDKTNLDAIIGSSVGAFTKIVVGSGNSTVGGSYGRQVLFQSIDNSITIDAGYTSGIGDWALFQANLIDGGTF